MPSAWRLPRLSQSQFSTRNTQFDTPPAASVEGWPVPYYWYRLPAPCSVSLLPLLHITTKPGLLIYPDFISRESEEWLGRVRVADTGTVSKGARDAVLEAAAVFGTNYSQMFLLWPVCRTELVPTMLQMCCYIQHHRGRRQRFFLVGRIADKALFSSPFFVGHGTAPERYAFCFSSHEPSLC